MSIITVKMIITSENKLKPHALRTPQTTWARCWHWGDHSSTPQNVLSPHIPARLCLLCLGKVCCVLVGNKHLAPSLSKWDLLQYEMFCFHSHICLEKCHEKEQSMCADKPCTVVHTDCSAWCPHL